MGSMPSPFPVAAGATGDDDSDDVIVDDDVEESLDLVLLERMALLDLDGPGAGAADHEEDEEGATAGRGVLLHTGIDTDLDDVAPRGSDEFVCRSCFLVRRRVQLVDPAAMVCHDCSN